MYYFVFKQAIIFWISHKMVNISNISSSDLTTIEIPTNALYQNDNNDSKEEDKNGVYLVSEYHHRHKDNRQINFNESFKKSSKGKQKINRIRRNRVETSESNDPASFECHEALRKR